MQNTEKAKFNSSNYDWYETFARFQFAIVFFFQRFPKQIPQNLFVIRNAPINVNPVEGGGSAGKGWGFDGEVHPLSGKFD